MKQKVVYLNCGEYTSRRANEDLLNEHIGNGWTVKQIALGNNSNGVCFGYAILEMEDEKATGIEMS